VKKVLIITGPAGDAQGWGDLSVTESLRDALCTNGKRAEIAFVESMEDFIKAIESHAFDIIWSALYHISDNADTIGLSVADDAWLADHFDSRGLPYIGPNAQTMKQLIDKTETHRILQAAGIPVPMHYKVGEGDKLPQIDFPAFVKPSCESRSVGISDESVVHTQDKLASQVGFIHSEYQQPALIEDYLPGQEYTVLMLGNGDRQKFLPGIVTLDGDYGKYPILRADLRGVGITKIKRPDTLIDEANELCRQAVTTLNCHDHVRVDMRLDSAGQLRIIEVNGIPGLKPLKSWSPQMYTLYYGSEEGPDQDYRNMVNLIVDTALQRYGIG
jgi:D-alanine-D-alanine ligase